MFFLQVEDKTKTRAVEIKRMLLSLDAVRQSVVSPLAAGCRFHLLSV